MKTGKWERIMPEDKSIFDVTPEEARQAMAKLGFPPPELDEGDEDEDLERYCPVCERVTKWEDGFNIVTGIFSEWCTEHEGEAE